MKLTRHTPAGFVLCLTLALYGCGSRPDEQLALAQKAMDQAKEQRAAEFAPSEWRNAEDAWQKAQALLASESYGEAGTLFLRAKSRYERSRDIAKSKRDDVRKEVQGMESTIDLRYKSLKDNISRAKLTQPRKQALTDFCSDIDKSIDKIKAEMEQGEYPRAKETAQATLRQVYEAEKALLSHVTGKKSS
jgi:Domain of unknown function (DUF4398)